MMGVSPALTVVDFDAGIQSNARVFKNDPQIKAEADLSYFGSYSG